MPSIYLNQTTEYTTRSSRSSESVNVSVAHQPYQISNLFKRYKHEPKNDKTGVIKIYKSMSEARSLTIKPDKEHTTKQLQHAYVYFNQFDKTHSNPLLLSLHFENGKKEEKYKYFQYTEIKSYFSTRRQANTSDMDDFTNYNDLNRTLISENYYTNNSLTYLINKTNNKAIEMKYNSSTISISQKQNVDNGQSSGFYKYTHTPKSGAKKSYFLYNMNVLNKTNKQTLEEIQGQVYSSLVVYFGTRAKNLSRTNRDIPLLIELTKKTTPRDPDYYVHKKNSDGYYWENLKDTISDLLTDIGLSTSSTGRGYDQLKGILRKATLSQGSENDLNVKLKRATGSKLQRLLSHKIPEDDRGVSSHQSLLTLLLRQIEFELVDSLIILLDKKDPPSGQYGESEVDSAVSNLDPKRDINRIKMSGKNITVTDVTGGKGQCVKNYKYRVYEHDFSKVVQNQGQPGNSAVALRFIIPSKTSATEYKQLALYSTIGLQTEPQNIEYIYYQKNGQSQNLDKVYVWFYDGTGGKGNGKGDPRPLMVCYNNSTYAPKNKESYFTEWVKVDVATSSGSTNECGCSTQGAQVQETENKLLQQLDKVVKFLNTVKLKEVGTSTRETSHKYEVQTFKSQKIQIKVECSTVGVSTSEPPSPPSSGTCSLLPSSSCYKKFKHTPAGIENGQVNGTGFRLGEIEHNGGTGGLTSTLNYAQLSSMNSYDPLISVTVFYYDHDKNFTDPLLIELDFNITAPRGDTSTLQEYYKLEKTSDGSNGITLTWAIDKSAQDKMGSTPVEYLDGIRYSLKKLLKIYIEKQIQYDLCLSNQAGESASTYNRERDKIIQVQEYKENGCTELKSAGYLCYVHQISALDDQFDYNRIGGLKFYISGKQGDGSDDVEIPMHKDNDEGDSGGGPLEQVTYNTCMGDVYVYFYAKHSIKTVDDVPLMLRYNDKFYEPASRDEYFKKWEQESSLHSIVKGPCGGENGKSGVLATMLDRVNAALNRINLTHNIDRGSTSEYGIPTTTLRPPKKPDIDVNRVDVTKISNKDPGKPYVKLVHRTSNGFKIGDIWYGDQDITDGVTINGSGSGDSIKVDNGGTGDHTSFVSTNKPNTVVVYYSNSDSGFKLPQLIVLMTTDQPIDERQYNITANSNSKYGYYILATLKGSNGYQYEWRTVEDTSAGSPFELNDELELSLLNSVVILVEQKPTTPGSTTTNKYDDEKIQPLVQALVKSRSLTKSPGLPEDINRLKHKQVTLKDATTEVTGPPPLSETGFRAISHDMTEIVAPKIDGAPEVTLIAILRFLIPTPEGGGQYKLLSLYDSNAHNTPVTLFHQNKQNSVYVYFYDPNKDGKGDPRPLLLCYNSKSFRAKTIDDYDGQKWNMIKGDKNCLTDGKKLLVALSYVSNFLNPLNIQMVNDGSYKIHKFNGQDIKIQVTKKDGSETFCYKWYTHSPEKEGFRLGRIDYGSDTHGLRSSKCIQTSSGSGLRNGEGTCINAELDEPRGKSLSASQVVVYYYGGDKNHKNPLLVVLCKNGDGSSSNTICISKQYYELQRTTDSNEPKKYKKETRELKLEDKTGSPLETLLDRILFNISNSLQIILGKRLDPIQLCPIERKRIKLLKTKKPFKDLDYPEMAYQLLEDAVVVSANMTKSIVEEGLLQYHNPKSYEYMAENGCQKRTEKQYDPELTTLTPTYKARVYNNTGTREQGPAGITRIKVQKIESKELANTGYQCYRHLLTDISDIDNFGGLRLFLWDNRNSDDNDDQCKPTPPNPPSKPKCCELDLHGDETQPSSTSCTSKIDPIAYTTCKGDLYVYFYGSDPRPMLLCYNGQSYAPTDLATYSQKWCRVKQIPSCECSDKGLADPAQLLKQLYKTSMFLNPVYLWETLKAYEKVKAEILRRKHRLLYLIQI